MCAANNICGDDRGDVKYDLHGVLKKQRITFRLSWKTDSFAPQRMDTRELIKL